MLLPGTPPLLRLEGLAVNTFGFNIDSPPPLLRLEGLVVNTFYFNIDSPPPLLRLEGLAVYTFGIDSPPPLLRLEGLAVDTFGINSPPPLLRLEGLAENTFGIDSPPPLLRLEGLAIYTFDFDSSPSLLRHGQLSTHFVNPYLRYLNYGIHYNDYFHYTRGFSHEHQPRGAGGVLAGHYVLEDKSCPVLVREDLKTFGYLYCGYFDYINSCNTARRLKLKSKVAPSTKLKSEAHRLKNPKAKHLELA
ncbi:unnamed protein product [Urochloa humidicola]